MCFISFVFIVSAGGWLVLVTSDLYHSRPVSQEKSTLATKMRLGLNPVVDLSDPFDADDTLTKFVQRVKRDDAAERANRIQQQRGQIEYSATATPMTRFSGEAPRGRPGSAPTQVTEAAESSVAGAFCGTRVQGDDTVIPGGTVICGDKNFYVADYVIDLGTDSDDLVQITLSGIECTTDDAEEIFLPGGVVTASGTPAWDLKPYTPGTDYDDSTNPSSPSTTGDIVVGLGRLIVSGGSANFLAVACGNIVIGQCAGILNHTR